MIPIVAEVVHISSARRLTITLTDPPNLSDCFGAVPTQARGTKALASLRIRRGPDSRVSQGTAPFGEEGSQFGCLRVSDRRQQNVKQSHLGGEAEHGDEVSRVRLRPLPPSP